jgi:hypothetical protein
VAAEIGSRQELSDEKHLIPARVIEQNRGGIAALQDLARDGRAHAAIKATVPETVHIQAEEALKSD